MKKDPSGNKKDLIQFFLFLIEPVNVFWYPPYITQIFLQVRNASIKILIFDKILNPHAFFISFFKHSKNCDSNVFIKTFWEKYNFHLKK